MRTGAHSRHTGSLARPGAHSRYMGSLVRTSAHSRYTGSLVRPAAHSRYMGSLVRTSAHSRYTGSLVKTSVHSRYTGSLVKTTAHSRYTGSLVRPGAHSRYTGNLAGSWVRWFLLPVVAKTALYQPALLSLLGLGVGQAGRAQAILGLWPGQPLVWVGQLMWPLVPGTLAGQQFWEGCVFPSLLAPCQTSRESKGSCRPASDCAVSGVSNSQGRYPPQPCCPGLPLHVPLVTGLAASCPLIHPLHRHPSLHSGLQPREGRGVGGLCTLLGSGQPQRVASIPLLASDISGLTAHLLPDRKSELSVSPAAGTLWVLLLSSWLRLPPTLLLPNSVTLALLLALLRLQVSSLASGTGNVACQGFRNYVSRGSG